MSRPIRFIGHATPIAYGRFLFLSISNQFRYHAYHIISKWKDIVINKNHLFTSHWSLFLLFTPLKNHLCGLWLFWYALIIILPGIFQNHRLLLLTVNGLISLEKFFTRISCGQVRVWWKKRNIRNRTWAGTWILWTVYHWVMFRITALWRLALVFIVPCVTLSSSNLQRLTGIPVDCF